MKPKMRMVSFAFAGVEPEIMGIGPVPSTEKALRKAGLSIDDIGLFELNEAFAVQVLSFLDHFGIDDDDPRVNKWGGAIAIGHPLASSGVRLMIQLARQFEEHPEVRYGVTAMCVGLGQGGTVIWENPNFEGRQVTMAEFTQLAELLKDDEVVTHSYVRDVPLRAGKTLALVTLDNGRDHTRPNTLGPSTLLELAAHAAVAQGPRVARRDPRGRGHGQAVHSRGRRRPQPGRRDPEHARSRSSSAQQGHATLGLLGDLGVPSFVFINGLALGGGMEIALNADYRTIDSSVPALALPEVFLGIIPGWGGAWLLPNLIGIENALKVIVENPLKNNRMLKATGRTRARHRGCHVRARRTSSRTPSAWADRVVSGAIEGQATERSRARSSAR